jgi:general secretion pathway protein G
VTNGDIQMRRAEESMKINMMDRKSEKGFSLIELIVVMVILALLAGIVGYRYTHQIGKSKAQAAKLQLVELGNALQMYLLDVGRYPDSLESLIQNPGVDAWNGPYLQKELPNDPWGKAYQYRYPGMHGDYDLFSLGPDGADGGDDDIVSWK